MDAINDTVSKSLNGKVESRAQYRLTEPVHDQPECGINVLFIFQYGVEDVESAWKTVERGLRKILSGLQLTIEKKLEECDYSEGTCHIYARVNAPADQSSTLKMFIDLWIPSDSDGYSSMLCRPVLAQFMDNRQYTCPLISAHEWDEIISISFGCFLGVGVFYEAYRLVAEENCRSVVAMFEHDLRRFNLFLITDYNDGRTCCPARYKIVVYYSSLVSLTVDNRESFLDFYFRLKYPATLLRKTRRLNDLDGGFQNTYRWFNAPDDLIGNCSVIRLRVDATCRGDYKKAWNIACRIRQRARVPVYIGLLRESEVKNRPSGSLNQSLSDMESDFDCWYTWLALKSRGLSISKQVDEHFCSVLLSSFKKNPKACQQALEFLLSRVDQHSDVVLWCSFKKYFDIYDSISNEQVPDDVLNPSYFRVRKVIITPTRRLLAVPDIIMSNRVLRKFGAEYALRVMFRTESGYRILASHMDHEEIDRIIRQPLKNGIVIGNRKYEFLGWSNSQLRDGGCYYYARIPDGTTATEIRQWMGDFSDIRNVAKLMARMGQCFTQAQSTVEIPPEKVSVDEDVTVGGNKTEGTKFCFSDGIGQISVDLAEELAANLNISPMPCGYQIRFGGFKGMLAVNPSMPKGVSMVLRKSMQKFTTENCQVLEVVKTSQPTTVNLNRPLILILDQIACGESDIVRMRMRRRISELLNMQLYRLADMLLFEPNAVAELTVCVHSSIGFARLSAAGIQLTKDAFFRNLMLSIYASKVKEQLHKLKVEVPSDLGRTLFGVLDETGVLCPNEVFIQISTDVSNPDPSKRKVIIGEVMVTKSPCIVPGDVRILRAVDRVLLRHFCDVIVFPKTGFRPVTDQMAGSDLDGDEYSVFWDKDLLFTVNYPPMSFEKTAEPRFNIIYGKEPTVKDMVNFFVRYLCGDSIGHIATSHLVAADRLGIFSDIPMRLAEKHAMAVDFPKTGVVPENLLPDEIQRKFPDYMDNGHRPIYKSRWLPGPMSRRVRSVADVIDVSNVRCPKGDQLGYLRVDGWERYYPAAIKMYAKYKQCLFALLCEYGVESEFQLFSGHFTNLQNRLACGERDDFSYCTTERVIAERLQRLVSTFRKRFAMEFNIDIDDPRLAENSNARAKASAWYIVAYSDTDAQSNRSAFSFPWLVWELLASIAERTPVSVRLKFNPKPFMDHLEDLINRCPFQDAGVWQLINNWKEEDIIPSDCSKGTEEVLYIFIRWYCRCCHTDIDSSTDLSPLGELFKDFLTKQEEPFDVEVLAPSGTDQYAMHSLRRSEMLMELLKYLGRLAAENEIDDKNALSDLSPILIAAFKTYHRTALTGNFASLFLEVDNVKQWDVKETEPFMFEPPNEFSDGKGAALLMEKLKEWSGVTELVWRRFTSTPGRDVRWKIVCAKGTLEARCRLYELLTSDNLQDAMYNDVPPFIFHGADAFNLIT